MIRLFVGNEDNDALIFNFDEMELSNTFYETTNVLKNITKRLFANDILLENYECIADLTLSEIDFYGLIFYSIIHFESEFDNLNKEKSKNLM